MIHHIACMMDGNRRWAEQQGLQRLVGHRHGVEAVKRIVNFCLDKSIPYLSLYTFSLENFKRSELEKSYIFDLFAEIFNSQQYIDDLIERGIRIRFIGDQSLFPASLIESCHILERKTAHLTKLNVNFLLGYGSRQEIIHATREIARAVAHGSLSLDAINDETFKQYLWTKGVPDPDIVIRSGKVVRLSNFLLYQSAYSEFYFLDCLWPDVTTKHLEDIVIDFNTRQRRFGG